MRIKLILCCDWAIIKKISGQIEKLRQAEEKNKEHSFSNWYEFISSFRVIY
jgi:hypothetical protein